MPIAFPLPRLGPPWSRPEVFFRRPQAQAQVAPNLALLGTPFNDDMKNPGFPRSRAIRQNLRRLGTMYADPRRTALVNPVTWKATDLSPWNRVLSMLRWVIDGVTRDGSGTPLGTCRVMIFSSFDLTFIIETTSDGSGNYSVYVVRGWFFFVNAYKAGLPDVAGTSLNTIEPIQT